MGKWKTATQMVGIPMLMAVEKGLGIPFPIIGAVAIYLSGIISVCNRLLYLIIKKN